MKLKRRKFLQIIAAFPILGYLQNEIKPQEQEDKKVKEAEMLIELVKFKHDGKFTDEQLKMLKEEIESGMTRRERLLSFKLSNWDEPDFKFQV